MANNISTCLPAGHKNLAGGQTRNRNSMENQNENINPLVSAFGKEKCWINWSMEVRDGKPDKIPYSN